MQEPQLVGYGVDTLILNMRYTEEKYQFKALCPLAFFSVHFVLRQDTFCSPRITIDSSFSRV